MARRFFNQKVKKAKKNKKTLLILIGGIIGVIALILIAILIAKAINNTHKNAVVVTRDKVAVEVNTKLPDKTLFFAELTNVKEKDIKADFSKVELEKIGKYKVTLKIYGKKYSSTLEVVDTEAPTLKTKELNINVGDTYQAKDFVTSCTDNSKQNCIIDFYDLSIDQKGNSIDYSAYTKEGTYTIQIIARDTAGNVTTPISTKLNIGKKESKPKVCKFGNNEYDKDKYILSIDVTEDGCALDLNLYKSPQLTTQVKNLIKAEEEKLKNEFSKIKLDTKDIYVNTTYDAILNKKGEGIVGYSLFVEVSINNKKEVIESYHLTQDGKRKYVINKYL